ncbi:MAG: mechanosensitive ion channel family protein [Deltaproteobacteria bacterium]|nr:mechanosensitive ion channel family protein [Deltaproteobacteria bacterium]
MTIGSVATVILVAAALSAQTPALAEGPCATPRRAAATILGNLARAPEAPDLPPGDDAVRRALRCVDVPRGLSHDTVVDRLRTLQDTLDAVGVIVRPVDIPDDNNHLDARTFRAVFVLSPQAPRIRLQKNDRGEWRLPDDTVLQAEAIHDDLVGIDLERFTRGLSSPWHRSFFGVQAWQGVALLAVFGLALLLRFLLGALVTRRLVVFAKSLSWELSFDELRAGSRPAGWLVACATIWVLVPALSLPARWTSRLLALDRVVAAFCIVWLSMRVVDLVATHLESQAKNSPSRMDDHVVPLTRRIVKLLLVLLGVVLALQSFGVDVGSLVAGLGIGGLAVALAAKDTIGNFFGSVAIFLDRPFQIGDWVATTSGAVEGTVETVGFRSTQIRTIADTIVTVPNAKMADAEINNFGARRHRRVRLNLAVTRDVDAEQLATFTQALHDRLTGLPHVKSTDVEVVAHDFTDSAIVVLVHFYVTATTWSEELRQRHGVVLDVLRLAQQAGLRLALPTRAISLEPSSSAAAAAAAAPSTTTAAAASRALPAEAAPAQDAG